MKALSDKDFFELNKDVRINNLQILGTHDSSCYPTEKEKTFYEKIINSLKCALTWIGIKKYDLIQNKTISNQLEIGIRAFDLRVMYDEISKDFFFVHNFYYKNAREVLKEIRKHFDKNPKSFLILIIKPDFHHKNTFSENRNTEFKDLLYDILSDKFILKNGYFPKLKECIEEKRSILCGFLDELNVFEKWIWGSEYFVGALIQAPNDENFYKSVKFFIENTNNSESISHISLVKNYFEENIKKEKSLNCHIESIFNRLKEENFLVSTNIFWIDFPNNR